MEQRPIRLTWPESREAGNFKITFNLGPVNHPTYGSAEKLSGEFVLLNSEGSFPIPNYFQLSEAEQDEIFETNIQRLRSFYPTLSAEALKKTILELLITAVLCNPRVDIKSQAFEVGLYALCAAHTLDEALKHTEPTKTEAIAGKAAGPSNLLTNYFGIQQNELNELPWMSKAKHISTAKRAAIKLIDNIFDKIKALYPEGLPKAINDFYEASMHDLKGDAPSALSMEAFAAESEFDSRLGSLVEIFAALQGYDVPANVRSVMHFGLLLEGVRDFVALSNEIMYLGKEICEGSTSKNLVLRKVVPGRVTLEQSFGRVVKRFQRTCADLKNVIQKLVSTFPDDRDLAGFIQTAYDVCDGQNLAHFVLSRFSGGYGSTTMNLE